MLVYSCGAAICAPRPESARRTLIAQRSIPKIVLASSIESSPIQEDLCEGVMHLRGQVMPVVRFATVLQTGTTVDASSPHARVIVLQAGATRVGLLVDAVESIETYADDELMHVPVLSRYKAAMFGGCIDLGERGHVFLLDSAAVLDNDELRRVTGNFSQLFATREDGATAGRMRAEQRQSYLWFSARDAFALPMVAVREIIDCSGQLIGMPGAPAFAAGMVNLRGKLVTVVDVRAFYALGDQDVPAERRIVVLDDGDALLGLLVDSVDSIARVDAADRIPVPQLMRNAMPAALRDDVREIIQVADAGQAPHHVRVLDPVRVFASSAARDTPAHADA